MSIAKNWKATSITGTVGYELIVIGEANIGLLTVMPELYKRNPQGINPTILQLDLLNAGDTKPENFKPVQYNEKITSRNQYVSVEIFHQKRSIELIKVK